MLRRLLLAERRPFFSSFAGSAAGAAASAAGASAAASATGSAAAASAGAAAGSSTGLGSGFLGFSAASVSLYFSDSLTASAAALASAILALISATQPSRSALLAALNVCLWPLVDRTNLWSFSATGSSASACRDC